MIKALNPARPGGTPKNSCAASNARQPRSIDTTRLCLPGPEFDAATPHEPRSAADGDGRVRRASEQSKAGESAEGDDPEAEPPKRPRGGRGHVRSRTLAAARRRGGGARPCGTNGVLLLRVRVLRLAARDIRASHGAAPHLPALQQQFPRAGPQPLPRAGAAAASPAA